MPVVKPIYLDNAAATPIDDGVLEAMRPYFSEYFHNPSASYLAAKKVREDISSARSLVAGWLGARPTEICFTAGGTEANNLAIHGILRRYPGSNIVISSVEHESIIKPAELYDHKTAEVHMDGRLNLDDLKSKIDSQTVLASVMYANNEVGTVQPIRDISKIVKEVRQIRHASGNGLPLFLHIDACQAANYLDLHVSRLGVDMMSLNGGKIYGPKQSGCLYIKTGTNPVPLIDGGGQESGLRSGTESAANIIGFSKALDVAQTLRDKESKRLQALGKEFEKLIAEKLEGAKLNGSEKYRLPNNVHLTFPGIDNERLLYQLDEVGILAAAGSACSASDEEPSHVLRAMGLSVSDAQSSVRFTMGRGTSPSDIRTAVRHLAELTRR